VKVLLDERIPFRLAVFLVNEGHDDVVCGRDLPQALSDREILATAFRENRLLLTNDKDFGDLVFRDQLPHAGVILFRFSYMPIDNRIRAVQHALTEFANQLDQFIVVSVRGTRVAVRPGTAETPFRITD
jgi:predicted nuclease of predicted toxin-antitoxin system